MLAHGYVARVTGGTPLAVGPEGPVRAYPLSDVPRIMPIRVANRRTLEAYLDERRKGGPNDRPGLGRE